MRILAKLVAVIAVAGVIAGALAWREQGQSRATTTAAPTEAAPRPLELAAAEVTVVAPQHLRDIVRFSGSLRPIEQTVVKSRVAGRLADVLAREGETVTEGQTVARLDLTEVSARLSERESMLRAAEADATLAAKTRANKLALFERGIVSRTQVDQAEADHAYKRSVVAANQAQVDVARKTLSDAVVKAPIDGIVAERIANPGESIPVDGRILTLVDTSRMEVEAMVPASDVARLKTGQPAAVRVDGFGERRFPGTIARINPMTQSGSRSVPVYVTIGEREPALRGGMFATGDVVVAEKADAIAVPPKALRQDQAGDFVLAVRDGALVRQPVRILANWARGDLVEIEGLAPGTMIVVAHLPGLKPGQAVRPLAPQS